MFNMVTGSKEPVTFCGVSDCLRHDPSAVWTYLIRVLLDIKPKYPGVKVIHFYSEWLSNQYRQNIVREFQTSVRDAAISSKIWKLSNKMHVHQMLQVVLTHTGSAVNMMAEKGTNWNESQTLLLIDCYEEYVSLVHSGKVMKKTLWKTICSKFQEMGYGFSSEQICGSHC